MPSSRSAVVAAGAHRVRSGRGAARLHRCPDALLFPPNAEVTFGRSTQHEHSELLGFGRGEVTQRVVTATSAPMILDSSWARSAAARRSARCCSLLRRRSAASASDCSARESLVCRARPPPSRSRLPVSASGWPPCPQSRLPSPCARPRASLLLRVEVLVVFAAACRALAASARFEDSFDRYSPAFLSASIRCLRLRSKLSPVGGPPCPRSSIRLPTPLRRPRLCGGWRTRAGGSISPRRCTG
jgi:hypothetical protein